MLLTAGGLLLRSFTAILDRDLGYDVEGIVTAEASLFGRYEQDRFLETWRQLDETLRGAPGVAVVGFSNAAPGGGGGTGFILVEGRDEPGREGEDGRLFFVDEPETADTEE